MLDLAIRGGTVVDGTGAERRSADVGIRAGRIVSVGVLDEPAQREISADGLLVTPGWVDVHTHYDGQVTWDAMLTPSCWHGVTTVVMGNCGVGFAPVKPGTHDYLIKLMEGVEDIPGTALAEGIDWQWESFPEYLDAIASKPHSIDVAAQIPHAALRFYVMGERGADHEEDPTPAEIESMSRLVREGITAGALGFTTSRTKNHRSSDGRYTPSLTATADELLGIGRGLGEAGQGVIEIVTDHLMREQEWDLMREMVRVSGGRPLSVSLAQNDVHPEGFREQLRQLDVSNAQGLPIKGQVAARAIGIMFGLEATLSPFATSPHYAKIASLPLAERVAKLRDPELRRAIVSEERSDGLSAMASFDKLFRLGDPPDYEPSPDQSVAAEAKRQGKTPAEHAYDLLLEDDGRALLYRPFLNYADHDLEAIREMLAHEHTVPGLGDAGAHCGMICDGSFPTFLLSHWGRERTRGEKLPLEALVKSQSRDTARLVGLDDRGTLEPGMKADVNLIDFDRVGMNQPEIVYDLPAGGKRLLQRATGYATTIQSGEVTFEDGEATGALPGKLVRGPQTPD
jgi:N-acyl-D-aspartate/D-glutamate deacylase